MERPNRFAGREFLTDAEVAAKRKDQEAFQARKAAGTSYEFFFRAQANFNNIFAYDPHLGPISRRTAQIIDPPSGRLPPLTAEAIKRWEDREALSHGRGEADSYIDRTLAERCIGTLEIGRVGNWGLGDPPTVRPVRGGAGVQDASIGLQGVKAGTPREDFDTGGAPEGESGRPGRRILQAPGYVAIFISSDGNTSNGVEEYRIIPLSGLPRLGPMVKQFGGDRRGRWEGEELVVETANLNDPDPMMTTYGASIYPGTRETLRIAERYKLVDADHLEYRYTVDDPQTYTRPYTVLQEFTRDDNHIQGPDLCHENNKDLSAQLAAARADEAAAQDFGAEYAAARAQRLEEVKAELTARPKK